MGVFGRALSLIGAGLFATVLFVTHPGFAFAQDESDGDAEVVEQPDVTVPDLSCCWQGDAFNDSQGNTSIIFFFVQKKKQNQEECQQLRSTKRCTRAWCD